MGEIPFVASFEARQIIKDLVGLNPIGTRNALDQYIFVVNKSKDIDDLQALFKLVQEKGMIAKSLYALHQIYWLTHMKIVN